MLPASHLMLSMGPWRIAIWRSLPTQAELSGLYDRNAWRWRLSLWFLGVGRAYRQLMRELVSTGRLAMLSPHCRVLDAGLGSGDFALALAEQLTEPPEIHGVDLSPRMLALARRRLSGLGQEGLSGRLRLAALDDLPYPSETFDLVLCAHVIEHCDAPDEGIKELMRVLKPNGALILVTSRVHALNLVQGARWGFQPVPFRHLQAMLTSAGARCVCRHAFKGALMPSKWISQAVVAIREAQPEPSARSSVPTR